MAKQSVNIGSSENKGDGDPLRTAFQKINENFDENYASLEYNPAVVDDWANTAPVTFGEAIDRLAALIKTLNNGTGA